MNGEFSNNTIYTLSSQQFVRLNMFNNATNITVRKLLLIPIRTSKTFMTTLAREFST